MATYSYGQYVQGMASHWLCVTHFNSLSKEMVDFSFLESQGIERGFKLAAVFSARRYASGVYAMALCLHVCVCVSVSVYHKSVSY